MNKKRLKDETNLQPDPKKKGSQIAQLGYTLIVEYLLPSKKSVDPSPTDHRAIYG